MERLLDKWLGVVLAHRKINRLVVSVAFTIYKTGINRRGWWDNKGGCSWLHLVFNCRWHKPTNAGTVREGVFCVLQGGSSTRTDTSNKSSDGILFTSISSSKNVVNEIVMNCGELNKHQMPNVFVCQR